MKLSGFYTGKVDRPYPNAATMVESVIAVMASDERPRQLMYLRNPFDLLNRALLRGRLGHSKEVDQLLERHLPELISLTNQPDDRQPREVRTGRRRLFVFFGQEQSDIAKSEGLTRGTRRRHQRLDRRTGGRHQLHPHDRWSRASHHSPVRGPFLRKREAGSLTTGWSEVRHMPRPRLPSWASGRGHALTRDKNWSTVRVATSIVGFN